MRLGFTSWSNAASASKHPAVEADELDASDHAMAQAVAESSFDEEWYDLDDFETVDY